MLAPYRCSFEVPVLLRTKEYHIEPSHFPAQKCGRLLASHRERPLVFPEQSQCRHGLRVPVSVSSLWWEKDGCVRARWSSGFW